jgi:hypothetical protein
VTQTADVVIIIGAGIIGGSIAFHLLERDPRLRVVNAREGVGAGDRSHLGRLRCGVPRGGPPGAATGRSPGDAGLRGFSGHGFMHSPTEMLLDGRASSMDIRALSLDRFAAGRLRAEANMF